ncbi:cell division protein SepF [Corynebacterium liangguodongii]|uniref:Cell division protein SepF n=1 Tax=Corynebacterium liangguodongii TaxID=2079535 RepID=A0A2S0WF00_9CORY|nr:cell division protein SepF [Corynebacterium liangguodongii]AWB84348.1 cell division protein SepF [Corynebacterium liangguodongii]PWB99838.1 DUF552 domain-containing protein [Corynebacterium liangguodongii]
MSILDSAKEFFGLNMADPDEVYYDDHRYAPEPSAVGGRDEHTYAPAPRRDYGSTRVRTAALVTAAPRSYNDAREIGEPFRDGDAVIMELTDLDPADAKRLVDFAAGLCFALRGKMHNLGKASATHRRVFAIVPEGAEISPVELERAAHLR